MEMDVKKNPGLLKLELYCKGMRIDPSCNLKEGRIRRGGKVCTRCSGDGKSSKEGDGNNLRPLQYGLLRR